MPVITRDVGDVMMTCDMCVTVAVVVAFFCCWAPYHAQRLMTVSIPHDGWSPMLLELQNILFYLSGIFFYISATVNPILYNVMSKKFRRAFKDTLCRCLSNKLGGAMFYDSPTQGGGAENSVTCMTHVGGGVTAARFGGSNRPSPPLTGVVGVANVKLLSNGDQGSRSQRLSKSRSSYEKPYSGLNGRKSLKDFINFRRKKRSQSAAAALLFAKKVKVDNESSNRVLGHVDRNSIRSVDSANSTSSVTSFATHIREELELRDVLPPAYLALIQSQAQQLTSELG